MINNLTLNRLAALALLLMVWAAGFDSGRQSVKPAPSRPIAHSPR